MVSRQVFDSQDRLADSHAIQSDRWSSVTSLLIMERWVIVSRMERFIEHVPQTYYGLWSIVGSAIKEISTENVAKHAMSNMFL